jgi:uncharacterized Zn-binding protein involved in type VI secretion
MIELIMNSNGTIQHGNESPVTGGVFTITSTPDVKAKINGVSIHVGPLTFSFSGGSAAGFVPGSLSGTGTIAATASKVKVGGTPVIREGDTGTLNAAGVLSAGGTGNITGAVEVGDAGQQHVKAE